MRTNRIITITFSVVLALSACHKRVPTVALPPAPSAPSPAAVALDEADRAFSAARYDDAARAYENYLRLSFDSTARSGVISAWPGICPPPGSRLAEGLQCLAANRGRISEQPPQGTRRPDPVAPFRTRPTCLEYTTKGPAY